VILLKCSNSTTIFVQVIKKSFSGYDLKMYLQNVIGRKTFIKNSLFADQHFMVPYQCFPSPLLPFSFQILRSTVSVIRLLAAAAAACCRTGVRILVLWSETTMLETQYV
jgi:hypothetical protein